MQGDINCPRPIFFNLDCCNGKICSFIFVLQPKFLKAFWLIIVHLQQGLVVERIRASLPAEGNKKIIDLGDGTADFCAGLKLEEGDFLMPRKNYPIWEIICNNRSLIKAKVHEWKDGEDLETILLN